MAKEEQASLLHQIDSLVSAKFIVADEPFAKALRNNETCASVNDNLWGKLVSSSESPIIFDERFKVTSVPLFITNFNLILILILIFWVVI